MQKTKSVVGRRGWNFRRLALLWARKGGVFKRSLMVDIRLLPKFIKTLRHSRDHYYHQRGALRYGERELSFDDTPVIHVKMHRPSSLRLFKIPCITSTPEVDFDYDFDPDPGMYNYYNYNGGHQDVVVSRKSFLKGADDEEQDDDDDNECGSYEEINGTPAPGSCSDEGIDLKAEQFIAKFYQQIKMQRQISNLEYHEMIARGAN
ncbi:hypothetical protein ACH5RR_019980 [Cinchona calisaya]|uniref:Uncharacterized protein n=1 Tax=Cinchona calisaya TaxID=153742 RepID=A0ABD2ZEX1_9GENT